MANDPTRPFLRARQPEHKELRRQEILAAAGKLLDEHGVEGTGLSAIAREAGISKGNVYRYFESREAVLLQLLLDEQELWCEELEAELPSVRPNDLEGVAEVLTNGLVTRPRYCALIASLAGVLEHNLSRQAIAEFKRSIAARSGGVLAALHASLPQFSEELCGLILTEQVFAAGGFWPHCHPAPAVQEVLEDDEFAEMRFDFETLTRSLTHALLRGHTPE
ncbi:MAG: TetR/AcrR family transcriptional regulator [Thermoanaerobaculia bacterium]|nr:TetR/AcrR family transcriptional regulator [Thermoanaerobaculia bacterium]